MSIVNVIFTLPDLWRVANEMRDWHESLFAHSVVVADIAAAVAEEMGCLKSEVEGAKLGGFLHDLGKVLWPKYLLSKPRLDDDDMKIVRVHPLTGAALAREQLPWLEESVLRVIEEHHEKPGGGGYPRGAKEVCFLARLVGAVECFVALVEERPYRQRCYTVEEALLVAAAEGFDASVLAAARSVVAGNGQKLLRPRVKFSSATS